MKIILISDTHTRHEGLGELPKGDLLIHAGDFTFDGSWQQKLGFAEWFYAQPHPYKVYIAGNHDSDMPLQGSCDEKGVFYLFDSGCKIEGLTFWGSPHTPRFGDWAYMYKRPTYRWKNRVPDRLDVLITHGPPKGILDRMAGDGESCGCEDLRERVFEVQPRLHVFGHIHGGYGQRKDGETLFVNASSADEAYNISHEPIVVEI